MNRLTVGVTGSRGFIGSHLVARLERESGCSVCACDREVFNHPARLADFVSRVDAIVHLAGMNRGADQEIFDVNVSLAQRLVDAMQERNVAPRVIVASSTQQSFPNPYGRSKLAAVEIMEEWGARSGAPVTIEIIPNVFGAGCRPFYNSVVATFCHQLAVGDEPRLLEDREIELICVRELVECLVHDLSRCRGGVVRHRVCGQANLRVSQLLDKLRGYRNSYFDSGVVPELADAIQRDLYTTFLSYLRPEDWCHRPVLHSDERGDLVEVIKTRSGGQVFFSTTRPGVTRGNHYHTRKVEWFCVLKGQAVIRLRPLNSDTVWECAVDGEKPTFVTIPVMHTHHIENIGSDDLLTMFWSNELFDAEDPDTFFVPVAPEASEIPQRRAS